jgi:hypothetical protein
MTIAARKTPRVALNCVRNVRDRHVVGTDRLTAVFRRGPSRLHAPNSSGAQRHYFQIRIYYPQDPSSIQVRLKGEGKMGFAANGLALQIPSRREYEKHGVVAGESSLQLGFLKTAD